MGLLEMWILVIQLSINNSNNPLPLLILSFYFCESLMSIEMLTLLNILSVLF